MAVWSVGRKNVRVVFFMLVMILLTGCLGGGDSSYQATIVVKEGVTPLPGVSVSYLGDTSATRGDAGFTDKAGRVKIASLKGTVKISFALEGYTFVPQPLVVNKDGSYDVEAKAVVPSEVDQPVLAISSTKALNREQGVTFTVEPVTDVDFFYTLDGSDPDAESAKYEGEVTLTAPDADSESTITIKVIGIRPGYFNSEIVLETVYYSAKGEVEEPVLAVSKILAANRESGVTFTVEPVIDVDFFYTLDGSDPSAESAKYEGEVTLTAPDTDAESSIIIKVIGIRAGYFNSDVVQAVVTYQQGYSDFFFEDFEKYAEREYPDSFYMHYEGTGEENQEVVRSVGWDGVEGKAFRLEGRASWSSEQLVFLPDELPETLVVKAWVRPISGNWPGRIGLYNKNVGSWGTRVSGVLFEGDKIKVMVNGSDSEKQELTDYEDNCWYQIIMVHNLVLKTYDVYVDNVLMAENVGLHPSVVPDSLNLTAGNKGTNEIYFDEVYMGSTF